MERLTTPLILLAVAALAAFVLWPSGGKRVLHLTFEGLPPLQNGYFYEGWAIIDGEPWTTGRFVVAADGSLVGMDGNATGGDYLSGVDLTDAAMVSITVHAPSETEGPSSPHLISGPITELRAPLDVYGVGALEATFDEASATVRATDSEVTLADISLPQLSGGWVYEAWVETDSTSVSLGRFGEATDHSVHDHSGGHPAEGTPGLVPYADIIADVDSRGGRVSITVELLNDDSPEPFGLTVLTAGIPTNAEAGEEHALTHDAARLPTGLALIR